MADTPAARAAAIEQAAQAVKELGPDAQAAAMKAVVPPPDQTTTNDLWRYLVGGLLLLIAIALCGLIYLLARDKTSDTALTAFSALLAGLLGLFAPSPAKGEGGGED
jgi:hypothetical protein